MHIKVVRVLAILSSWLLSSTASAIPVVPAGYTIDLYASGMGAISGLVFAPDDSLVVSDYGNGRILKVAGDGSVQTLATGLLYIVDSVYTSDGSLYAAVSGTSHTIYKIASDGASIPYASGFSYPTSLAVWKDELYITNSGNGAISKVDTLGNITTVVTAPPSRPNGPYGISFDAAGTMYYLDHGTGGVYAYDFIAVPQLITSVTRFGGTDTGIGFGGNLFVADVNIGTLLNIDANGIATPFATGFAGKNSAPAIGPHDFLYDGVGHMYVGDGDNIWKITGSSAVPEPDTLALLAIGLFALMGWRRTRIKQ